MKKSYGDDPWVPLAGRALAAAIKAKGLSVRAFADVAGERPQTVQKLVNSGKLCRASRRANLAKHLGVSESFLAGQSTARAAPIAALKVDQLLELVRRILRRPRMAGERPGDAIEVSETTIARARELRELHTSEELHGDLVSLLSLEQWRWHILGDERWNWYPSPDEEDRFAELIAEAVTLVLTPLLRGERRMARTSNRDLEAIGVVRDIARRIRDA